MTPRQILSINAAATALTAVAMLAGRSILAPLFGLATPVLLDAVAVAFLAYAGVLGAAASRRPVPRGALLAFAAADSAWVVVSAIMLVLFWPQLTPIARALAVAVAIVCEAAATLQFRAAGGLRPQTKMSGSHA